MNKVVRIILGILVGLIILGIVGVTITYTKLMEPVSSSDEIVTVQIPSGASATTIGTQLKNAEGTALGKSNITLASAGKSVTITPTIDEGDNSTSVNLEIVWGSF